MLKFDDPEDSFVINGRGVYFSSGKWRLPENIWEPWDLTNTTVKLMGKEVKIIGVDAFAIRRSPTNPYRLSFALGISFEEAKELGNYSLRNRASSRRQ